ncbi:hypothetical protein [Labedaea rhizosphaerae]|uniref:Uncharacterized protein n=1 Tax=Labedaea rhizosphaerae TaxID=598644 RepID=A0A4R6SCK9_LABRH|nr:hypothetical protein [Labedaea rhizosphaerae]TDP97640.1 hypothetical protein EV186_103604 [Labedaea rhizosphaerae]
MPSTPQWNVPYPVLSDPPNVPFDAKAIADRLEALTSTGLQVVATTGAIASPVADEHVIDVSAGYAVKRYIVGTGWVHANLAGGTIARGAFTGSKVNSGVQNAYTGVLRLDGVALKAGRHYRVWIDGGYIDGTGSDGTNVADVKITQKTGGTAAGTADTIVSGAHTFVKANDGSNSRLATMNLAGEVYPGADATYSFLLCFCTSAGSTIHTLTMTGAGGYDLHMIVEDMGRAPADTAVAV